jgi:hypothetical protein
MFIAELLKRLSLAMVLLGSVYAIPAGATSKRSGPSKSNKRRSALLISVGNKPEQLWGGEK